MLTNSDNDQMMLGRDIAVYEAQQIPENQQILIDKCNFISSQLPKIIELEKEIDNIKGAIYPDLEYFRLAIINIYEKMGPANEVSGISYYIFICYDKDTDSIRVSTQEEFFPNCVDEILDIQMSESESLKQKIFTFDCVEEDWQENTKTRFQISIPISWLCQDDSVWLPTFTQLLENAKVENEANQKELSIREAKKELEFAIKRCEEANKNYEEFKAKQG